jgi:hypothetical protein
MPAKGYVKWALYEYEGRESQTKEQSIAAVKHLKWMRNPDSDIRTMFRNGKYYVYYRACCVGPYSSHPPKTPKYRKR